MRYTYRSSTKFDRKTYDVRNDSSWMYATMIIKAMRQLKSMGVFNDHTVIVTDDIDRPSAYPISFTFRADEYDRYITYECPEIEAVSELTLLAPSDVNLIKTEHEGKTYYNRDIELLEFSTVDSLMDAVLKTKHELYEVVNDEVVERKYLIIGFQCVPYRLGTHEADGVKIVNRIIEQELKRLGGLKCQKEK